VGVGGQGAILVAKMLTHGLIEAGYDVKMSEVHGMASAAAAFPRRSAGAKRSIPRSSADGAGRHDGGLRKDGGRALRATSSSPTAWPSSTITPMAPPPPPRGWPGWEASIPQGCLEAMQNVVLFGALHSQVVPAKARELNLRAFRAGRAAAGK
jgi:hypothetical protein